ncbi:WW domain-containing protein [Fodinicurvata sediminis]|uniref:WW domain-containing protein n=1 Tax=Fodinicurvata sediminis TaxID=1121832 RepID=UPI0003B47C5F|nr:WW domain-containing protein [Fodinicurvata sediminis]
MNTAQHDAYVIADNPDRSCLCKLKLKDISEASDFEPIYGPVSHDEAEEWLRDFAYTQRQRGWRVYYDESVGVYYYDHISKEER